MQMAICPCDGFCFSLGAARAGGTRAIAPGYRVSCKGGFAGSESSARSRLLLVLQVPAWGAGAGHSLADAGGILRSPVAFTLLWQRFKAPMLPEPFPLRSPGQNAAKERSEQSARSS